MSAPAPFDHKAFLATVNGKPGVYRMIDRHGKVIYVGKAKNLRTRVRSYFYGDRRRRVADMLRDLQRIETQVCPSELEAGITELRLIHAHRPHYNRRSRPAKSTHWLRVTREEFPRLSIVRTQRSEAALAHLGPFRHRRTAEAAMHAIWDAVPIRRCTGRKGHPACRYAQLGVALCPCDGTLPAELYRRVTDDVVTGIAAEPERLLDPLVHTIRRLVGEQRFEEAADMRDRHRALARALQIRRIWQALAAAGVVWAQHDDGESVVIDHGRLLASWGAGEAAPLVPASPETFDIEPTPPSVAAAEELWLLWKWLEQPGVTIVDASSPLVMPARPVRPLTRL